MNTASKLAQDVGKDGSILVTSSVYKVLTSTGSRFLRGHVKLYQSFSIEVSKVKLECFKVFVKPPDPIYDLEQEVGSKKP